MCICCFTPPKLKVFNIKPTWYVGMVGVMAMEARKDDVEGAVKLQILEFVLSY